MTIEIEETTEPTGLEVYDSIEQRRLQIETAGTVSPTAVEPGGFCFPIDEKCIIKTDEIVLDQLYSVTIHEQTGQTEANLDAGETVQLEERTQFVGLSGRIKLYCRIDSPGTISVGLTSIRISLDRESRVELGIRSLHERPAATITTSADVESMMEAVSALPSALKTITAERTWPTLRGHPPLIELGDRLDIPDVVEQPTSDVTLTVPPEHPLLYQAAPLAFFLDATVRPGSQPMLETSRFERALPTGEEFENTVARLLKRFFFLECLTRTEGIFRYELHERQVLEDELPYDLAEIYEADLPERLEQYLDVPYERLKPHMPRWPLTAHVPADPDTIELLPYIINELGVVRDSDGRPPETVPRPDETSGLVRSASRARGSTQPSGADRTSLSSPT